MSIYIRKTEDAKDLPLPGFMTNGAAGMDLYANVTEEIVINKGTMKLIPAGIAIAVPEGFEAQVRHRIGLAIKHGIYHVNTPLCM